jgi:hypothetical protein
MKPVVMLGTDAGTMGGISPVIGVYRDGGLIHRQGVRHIPTNCDGTAAQKLRVMLAGWLAFMTCLLTRHVCILHIHLSSRASFWRKLAFLLPARSFCVLTIVHFHGSEFAVFYRRECGRLARWWVRWMFDGADRVIFFLSAAWNARVTVFPQ